MSDLLSILVTGDVVNDVNFYVDTTPVGDVPARGSVVCARAGGAALSRVLILAAAQAAGWTEAQVHLGLGGADDVGARALPAALHAYGVWTPHPVAVGAKDKVWRVSFNGGFGPGTRTVPPLARAEPDAAADIVVIDDGAIFFRYDSASALWPGIAETSQVVLKHSRPLCHGALFAMLLKTCADRLTIVVSVDDLRSADALVSARLSWEQTVIDTVRAIDAHPLLRALTGAARLVVNYGAAGALCLHRCAPGQADSAQLVFRPAEMEGERTAGDLGSVPGYQTCLVAAVAHRLASAGPGQPCPLADGVAKGLAAQRALFDLGHGRAGDADPGLPLAAIAQAIAAPPRGFVTLDVDLDHVRRDPGSWSLLDEQEPAPAGAPGAPMAGLAKLVARYGVRALDHVPSLNIGKLFTVDRGEIESLRSIKRAIRDYEAVKAQKKPLSIAVFGPPGAGKSFAVKEIAAESLKGSKVLEFNLSQFAGPGDLVGAFHQVRDEALRGVTPLVFWDEFDSREYFWLQYLLAPMQDGAFQEGPVTHPIGKCVFVFAGGTSATRAGFGPKAPAPDAGAEAHAEYERQAREFGLRKGPDFASRLHAHLDVLGPNPRRHGVDRTWPLRRALLLRGALGLKPGDTLRADAGLLHALLGVAEYRHGARSLEKLLLALRVPGQVALSRSALPAAPLLQPDVDAEALVMLMHERDAFRAAIDVEALAARYHQGYLDESARNGWPVQDRFNKPYAELDADAQSANRGAVLRIPELLELIDFKVEAVGRPGDAAWAAALQAAIDRHLERLAIGEHLGWMEERRAWGWKFAPKRDDARREHPAMTDWGKLAPSDQGKDRANVVKMVSVLQDLGAAAVAMGPAA